MSSPFCRRCLPIVLLLAGTCATWARSIPPVPEAVDFDEIIFACRAVPPDPHWYANFGYNAFDANSQAYAKEGRLCRYNLRTGKITVLLKDLEGTVRDPQVHYDGKRILFSYRPGGTRYFHLYITNADGTGLRQLTDGRFNDIEPTWLPGGGIMFCSSRCKRWVNCWFTEVAIIYRCNEDGTNIRQISANIEQDNTPWPLPDGRMLYTRWEYVDRGQVHFHQLWAMNPDGTEPMVYFGNQHPRTVIIDAKPIPGSRNDAVVAIFSPGHGKSEHAGVVTIVTPKYGPDLWETSRSLNPGDNFRDPFPISPDCFMVAQGARLVWMNGKGDVQEFYHLPWRSARAGMRVHEPRPLRPHPRERVIPARTHPADATGTLILADVHTGRNMAGVRPGEIKKLLVLETLPKPVNFSGGMEPLSYGGTFTLERVLGTVPVEPDGSAYMELPAKRSLFFVALDKNNNSVKRMQSFLSVMPGEVSSCVGCHEQRTRAPANPGRAALLALQRPPSRIQPIPGVPDVLDFPRDIQPILDRHCVPCHSYEKRSGGVVLAGDRGPWYSHSYITLTETRQFADGRNRARGNMPPYSLGTSASPLMAKLSGAHHNVHATSHEIDLVRYWIETGAAYPGTYASLGTGMVGISLQGYHRRGDADWPETAAADEVMRRRCDGCHARGHPLPRYISDEGRGLPPPLWRRRVDNQLSWNLSRPEKSLMLLAPLARAAGGYGICAASAEAGSPVLANTDDPDYATLLALCRAGKRALEAKTRFDMPNFRPRAEYLREMRRFGILPPGDVKEPVDVYALDHAYWRSLWYVPPALRGMP